jgi:hypothetical protein
MKQRLALIVMAFTFQGLYGCASMVQPGHELGSVLPDPQSNGSITLSGSSSRYIIKNKDGSYCFSPAPDAAFTDSTSDGLELTLVKVGDSSSNSDTIADAHQRMSLGGRNPNVLITRDILFETCLLIGRAGLNASQMLDVYKSSLDTITQINKQSLDGAAIKSDDPDSSNLSMSNSNGTASLNETSTASSTSDYD